MNDERHKRKKEKKGKNEKKSRIIYLENYASRINSRCMDVHDDFN